MDNFLYHLSYLLPRKPTGRTLVVPLQDNSAMYSFEFTFISFFSDMME